MLGQELPALIRDGYTSFKVYMTYDLLQLNDRQMLDILALARREGAFVMVHAENHDMITWLADRLLEQGHGAPRYHAVVHARIAEGEATNRAVALAELLDVPMLIVHVSAAEAIDVIRDAQTKGLKIYGETCPQYLFLTADDIGMDLEGHQILLLAAAARPRGAGGGVARLAERHVPGVLVRPRALSLRRDRQVAERRQDDLQGHRQRRARHRTARCRCCFPRASERAASTSTALSR